MIETISSRKESSLTFQPMKVGTNHVNSGKKKASPIDAPSNTEPGCLKNSKEWRTDKNYFCTNY